MRKDEFLKKLEALLKDIPIEEREEALAYYSEYFDDAGMEEEEVVKTLGTPEEVAYGVRREVLGKEIVTVTNDGNEQQAEGAANGYRANNANYGNANYGNANNNTNPNYNTADSSANSNANNSANNSAQTKTNDGTKVLLIVLLCVLAIPVGIPVLSAFFGLIVGILATLFGLLVAVIVCSIAFFIAGIALIGVGIATLFVAPLVGIVLVGAGSLVLGLCFLFTLATVKICTFVIPELFKGIVNLCRLPFNKKEGRAA